MPGPSRRVGRGTVSDYFSLLLSETASATFTSCRVLFYVLNSHSTENIQTKLSSPQHCGFRYKDTLL